MHAASSFLVLSCLLFSGPAQVSKANGVTFAAASERIKGRPAAYPFAPEEPVVSDAMKEALKAVFSKDGSYAQELVVDELVSAVDAMSREALGEAIKMVLSSATTVAALQSMEALGPLRSMLMPLPMASLDTITPTVRLTEEDREALHTIKYVMDAVGPRLANIPDAAIAGRNVVQATRELAPMIPELMPGIQSTMEKFVKKLLHRLALRLVEDLSSDKGNREQPMYK